MKTRLVLLLSFLLFLPSLAFADTYTYEYIGTLMTGPYFNTGGYVPGTVGIVLNLAVPLSPNMVASPGSSPGFDGQAGQQLSWSLTDGTTTIVNDGYHPGFFYFSTDAQGNITAWETYAYSNGITVQTIASLYGAINSNFYSQDYSLQQAYSAVENGNPGTWYLNGVQVSFVNTPSVPEPGTLSYILIAGGASGLRRGLRLRRS